MYDSVFTAYFQQGNIPFSDDRTITPERTIIQAMGKIESGGKSLLQKEILSLAHQALLRLGNAIASGDLATINKYNWSATARLSKAIWGVWVAGWDLGGSHAESEIKKLATFNLQPSNIIYFDREKKNVRRASIRNTPAENAIRQRVNKLAQDVSDTEWRRIKAHILTAISPTFPDGQPISREDLLTQINNELGSKSGRFANRAETIARTELTFAYNAGRLDTYQRSGLVSAVRYMAISDDRTCFPAGTLVTTAYGDKPIEKIKPGDMILTRLGLRPCRAVMKRPYSGSFTKVRTTEGQEVVSTSNHPFWTSQGWREAGTLSIGDELQTFSDKSVNIQSLVNFSFRDTNNSPSPLAQENVLSGIPSSVPVPVSSIDFQRNFQVFKSEINRISSDLEFLSERDSKRLQRFPDSCLKPSFPRKLSITRNRTKNRGITGDMSKALLAVLARTYCRRAAAFLRAIPSNFIGSCVKNFSTSFAIAINNVFVLTFFAANNKSVSYRLRNRERFATKRTYFVNRFYPPVIQVASLTTKLFRICQSFIDKSQITTLANFISNLSFALTRAAKALPSGFSNFVPCFESFATTRAKPFFKTGSSVSVKTRGRTEFFSLSSIFKFNPTSVTRNYHPKPLNDNQFKIVYNLEVEEFHEYFANGILVHNCNICSSRNGLVIPLSDAAAIAKSQPPLHPRCRCVLSPLLDTMRDRKKIEDPDRKEENRSIVPAPAAWMTAALMAALLVGGVRLATAQKTQIIAREIGEIIGPVAGTISAAEIISQRQGSVESDADTAPVEPTEPLPPSDGATQEVSEQEPETPKFVTTKPQVMVGEVDLNTATYEELRTLLPPRLFKSDQIRALINHRNRFPLTDLNDLYKIPKIGKKTGDALKSLAQGLDIVVDLNNARTWQQLWASNSGLTKTQAQALFDEIARSPLESIEDLRSRRIDGVGQKTIDEVIKRGFITQQSIKQRQKQIQTQGVGINQEPRIPQPPGTSRPEALERGQRQPPTPPPTPEGGAPTSIPSRPPSPYSGGGVGRSEPFLTLRERGKAIEPPPDQIDPIKQQALDHLSSQLDYLEGQAEGIGSELERRMSKKPLFRKSPKKAHEELKGAVGQGREISDRISSQLSDSLTQVDSLTQRSERMEQVFENLTNPIAPNYFERIPQSISNALAQLKGLATDTEKALKDIDSTRLAINSRQVGLNQSLNQVSALRDLEQGLESVRASLDNVSNLMGQLESLESEGSEYLQKLQERKDKHEVIQNTLATAKEKTRSRFASTLDDAISLVDELGEVRSQVVEVQSQIQSLQELFRKFPTTRQQLHPETRAKYDSSVKVRQLQRQFNKDLSQFRAADRQVQQGMRQSAQDQLDFYNNYDAQFTSYEQSTSPLIERRLRMLSDDVEALSRYPKRTVAWLLDFGSNWQFEPLPNDLALALRGVAPNQQVERVKALGLEVQQRFSRANNSIKLVRENSLFRYLEGGQRFSQAEAVKKAQDNLRYWQQQKDDLVSNTNIGSSSNRLDNLAKGQVEAQPNDTLGLQRRIAQNLDEWQARYQDLTQGTTESPSVAPSDDMLASLSRARDSFLEEAGQSRIAQSKIINDAYQEAQEIYERLRSDSSRVPVFDIEGKAETSSTVNSQVSDYEAQLEQFRKLSEIRTEPVPVESANVPRLSELVALRDTVSSQLDTIANQLADAQSQLTAATDAGRGTRRLQDRVSALQRQLNECKQQVNDYTSEIRDLRLPGEIYNQIQELKGRLDTVTATQERLKGELADTVSDLTPLLEQPLEGLSQSVGQRRDRVTALQDKRDRTTQRIVKLNEQINQLLTQINRLRNQ